MTTQEITDVYVEIKNGVDVFNNGSLDKYPTIIHYYLTKAHKLANERSFIGYWQSGINKDPLRKVLSTLYSPDDEDALQCCHSTGEGLPSLDKYVEVAKATL